MWTIECPGIYDILCYSIHLFHVRLYIFSIFCYSIQFFLCIIRDIWCFTVYISSIFVYTSFPSYVTVYKFSSVSYMISYVLQYTSLSSYVRHRFQHTWYHMICQTSQLAPYIIHLYITSYRYGTLMTREQLLHTSHIIYYTSTHHML